MSCTHPPPIAWQQGRHNTIRNCFGSIIKKAIDNRILFRCANSKSIPFFTLHLCISLSTRANNWIRITFLKIVSKNNKRKEFKNKLFTIGQQVSLARHFFPYRQTKIEIKEKRFSFLFFLSFFLNRCYDPTVVDSLFISSNYLESSLSLSHSSLPFFYPFLGR